MEAPLSNGIAFPKRPDAHPPSLATPMAPAWAMRHLDEFFDLDGWRVSLKGNRYLRLDGYCVTMFPALAAGRWCIASSARS